MVAFSIKDILDNRKNISKALIIAFAILIIILLVYLNKSKDDINVIQKTTQVKSIKDESDPFFDIKILNAVRDIKINSKRDLFRFYQEQPKGEETAPPLPQQLTIVKEPTQEEIIAKEQQQEPLAMMNLKLFGILNRNGKQIFAFISDGKEIYVVTKNNIFANQFKVTYIDEEKIEIMALKNKYKKTLTYTGGKTT